MSAGTGTRKNVSSPQNMDVTAATITTCLKDTPVSPAWVRMSWVFKGKLDGFRSAAGCHQNALHTRNSPVPNRIPAPSGIIARSATVHRGRYRFGRTFRGGAGNQRRGVTGGHRG